MIYYDKNTKIIGEIEDYNKNNNWTKINNELYYYKFFNFNELIGEYLAKYLNLDSVHNKLAIKNNTLYLLCARGKKCWHRTKKLPHLTARERFRVYKYWITYSSP